MKINRRLKIASTTNPTTENKNLSVVVNPYDLEARPDGNRLNWQTHEPEKHLFVSFKEKSFTVIPWHPSIGKIGDTVALDTETEMIKSGNVPRFVIGQVFGGGKFVYLLQQHHLKEFLLLHKDSRLVIHNAPFDLAVCVKETGLDLYEMVEREQIIDTALLYKLVTLACEDFFDYKAGLDHVAEKLFDEKLQKEDDIRLSFGQFRHGERIYYQKITAEHLQYAALDAVSTLAVYKLLMEKVQTTGSKKLLSHQIQLIGAIVLHHISLNGIGFDLIEKARFQETVEAAMLEAETSLKKFGYSPHQEGSIAAFEKVLRDNFPEIAGKLPRTEKNGQISRTSEDLDPFRKHCEFIDCYLEYQACLKLKSTFLENLNSARIHTNFNPMVATGRTSSWGPNLQNPPKKEGIRECFVPKPGHIFMIVDYSQIELCTLAQECLSRYGTSKMAELINQGVDLHRWFAAIIFNKPEKEVSKQERTWAKACNFGFPGGLGVGTFVDYARLTYKIKDMTVEQAEKLKNTWLDAFPEMREYLSDNLIKRHKFSRSHHSCTDPEIAYAMFKRIIGGATHTKGSPTKPGRRYDQRDLNWAFNTVMRDFAPKFCGYEEGSDELKSKVLRGVVETITGRIRRNATYCQMKNTPFQGLASDGAKIAMWLMWRAGLPLVHFIHDEFILELPESEETLSLAEKANELMIAGMKQVVPDVTVKTEWILCDRWFKGGEYQKDASGHSVYQGVMRGWKQEIVKGKEEKVPDFRPLRIGAFSQ